MLAQRNALAAVLPVCAMLPALIIGVVAMRGLGVSSTAQSINIAATVIGALLWFACRRLPPPKRRATLAFLAVASLAVLLLPFASAGVSGVYRWVSIGPLRLHVSAIVAPLVIFAVAAVAAHGLGAAFAISAAAAIILALQPDAAQATSVAIACAVILACAGTKQRRHAMIGVVLLLVIAAGSFLRRDPLPPVAHVEGIFQAASATGPAMAALAAIALLLLPAPFFVAWYRHRRPEALALGIYIALTVAAPIWGTFPVPIMGYGASPILGYFIALAAAFGGGAPAPEK